MSGYLGLVMLLDEIVVLTVSSVQAACQEIMAGPGARALGGSRPGMAGVLLEAAGGATLCPKWRSISSATIRKRVEFSRFEAVSLSLPQSGLSECDKP